MVGMAVFVRSFGHLVDDLGTGMTKMASAMDQLGAWEVAKTAAKIYTLSAAVWDFAAALNALPTEKIEPSFGAFVEASTRLTETHVKHVQDIVEHAAQYHSGVVTMKAASMFGAPSLGETMSSAGGGTRAGGPGGGIGPITVVVQVEGKQLGQAVIEALNEEYQASMYGP